MQNFKYKGVSFTLCETHKVNGGVEFNFSLNDKVYPLFSDLSLKIVQTGNSMKPCIAVMEELRDHFLNLFQENNCYSIEAVKYEADELWQSINN